MSSKALRLQNATIELVSLLNKAHTFPEALEILKQIYAQDYSFAFEFDGKKTAYTSIDQWGQEVDDNVKRIYSDGSFIVVNSTYNEETDKVEFFAYPLLDGNVVGLFSVQVSLVEEHGALKFKHCDFKLV